VSPFDEAFSVPEGHALRLVRSVPQAAQLIWEHAEHGTDGELVAIYKSWRTRGDGRLAVVKYSHFGWVLSVSGRSARVLHPKVPVGRRRMAPSALSAADTRQQC
jgi:hypothetical protein